MARRKSGRSEAEVSRLLDGYERSELRRREYCAEAGIPVTSFDYYRRRRAQSGSMRLAPVEIVGASPSAGAGFTLVLSNGRRIESGWNFTNADLARLVWVAEQS